MKIYTMYNGDYIDVECYVDNVDGLDWKVRASFDSEANLTWTSFSCSAAGSADIYDEPEAFGFTDEQGTHPTARPIPQAVRIAETPLRKAIKAIKRYDGC